MLREKEFIEEYKGIFTDAGLSRLYEYFNDMNELDNVTTELLEDWVEYEDWEHMANEQIADYTMAELEEETPESTEDNVVMYLKNYTTVLSTDDGGYMVELW